MAKARTETTTVEKKVTRVEKVPVKTIHLELTEGDADFLMAVLALIGGSTKNSPRKYGQRILKALEEATGNQGRYVQSTDAGKLVKDNGSGSRGAIYFNNYPDPNGGREIAAEDSPAEPVNTGLFDLGKYVHKTDPFEFHYQPVVSFADWPKPDFNWKYQ